jgi:hypothetical protein
MSPSLFTPLRPATFMTLAVTTFRWRTIAAASKPTTFSSFGRRAVVATSESATLAPFGRRSIPPSLTIGSRRAAIAVARRTAVFIAWPSSGELRTQLVRAQLAVGIGIELLKRIAGLRDLVGRDLMIAVGVQRFQQRWSEVTRRAAEATPRRTEPPIAIARAAAFAIGPAPASRFAGWTVAVTWWTRTITFRSCPV